MEVIEMYVNNSFQKVCKFFTNFGLLFASFSVSHLKYSTALNILAMEDGMHSN